jgi:uncharacterized phiE125 gp8 family phage protein
MQKQLIKPPSVAALSLDEMKAWLKIDFDDDNDIINALIASATSYVENQTRQCLIARQFSLSTPLLLSRQRISLPVSPIISIDSCAITIDQNVLPLDQYKYILCDQDHDPYVLIEGQASALSHHKTMLTFNVTSGFGPLSSDIPDPIRTALKMLVAQYYAYRGDSVDHQQLDHRQCDLLLAHYTRLKI